MTVLALAALLATPMSFAQAHTTLGWFVSSPPSTEVIEKTVLGLGRRTGEWFERAPAPPDDGEVLVIMVDSKGAPIATETELKRRRGRRKPNRHPESARHRGRDRRARYGKKPRRKKGDKSKTHAWRRAEALLQLRCIEKNGDWDAFIQWVHDDWRSSPLTSGKPVRVQQKEPLPLPAIAEAA